MVDYGILGPLTARVDGRAVRLGGARTRAVLAVLLLDRNVVVSVDRLVDLVWGDDPPPTAQTALHGHISRLRRLLGPQAIETRPPGYLLRVGAGEVDVECFESLLRRARAAPSGEAGELLREALGLWQGPALADLADQPLARVEIARLEALHLDALEARIEADLAAGRDDALVAELDALVAEHPYRERLHSQRILALYRSGRQAEALAAYRAARAALDEGLGLDPGPELQALETRILQQDPNLAASAAAVPAARASSSQYLALTPILGREEELRRILSQLDEARLVIITGPGGMGKTRLALEVAREREMAFIDLTQVIDHRLVPAEIAAAIGIELDQQRPAVDALAAAMFGDRQLLLDNLEQLDDPRAAIAPLLLAAPGLRVLGTSRVPLRVPGEVDVALGPLAVPASTSESDVAASPAAALLLARIRSALGAHDQDPDAATIAELSWRLDGIPLALELAGARARMMPAGRILEVLANGEHGLLTGRGRPDRQRSLEAVLAWSVGQLDAPSSNVLAAAAVCAGGWDVDLVSVISGGAAAYDAVGELIELGLVRLGEDHPSRRFALLETVRHRVLRGLDGPLRDSLERRHAGAMLDLARSHGSRLDRFDSCDVPELDRNRDNLRAALDRCLRTDPAVGAEIATRLGFYWFQTGAIPEGISWLRRYGAIVGLDDTLALHLRTSLVHLEGILDSVGVAEACRALVEQARIASDPAAAVRALTIGSGAIAWASPGETMVWADEAEALARAHDLTGWLGRIAYNRAAIKLEDEPGAAGDWEAAAELSAAAGDNAEAAMALSNLTSIQLNGGQPLAATLSSSRALELLPSGQNPSHRAFALAVHAAALAAADQPDLARRDWLEAARIALVQSPKTEAHVLWAAAHVLDALNLPALALTAIAAADSASLELGMIGLAPSAEPAVARVVRAARASLGAGVAATAEDEGRTARAHDVLVQVAATIEDAARSASSDMDVLPGSRR
ncbi:MAG: BTAD domain-containing putative transcriptional regulator [Candidatus Limnocylindrales bacterium]